ncbi:hypothetical protein CYMTET_15808 [Cymbomonas tetramitiformis]|uniref:Sulfotransferase n=1 Tax=Cymbomonas tetramitiformis TaxID=36881 RepID=A0AAE0GDT3_9CHLO|nr:hypothetical protein CYMTET_15808 [Cymbomonas tetramitiformis]
MFSRPIGYKGYAVHGSFQAAKKTVKANYGNRQEFKFITAVRHPVERLISHFYHCIAVRRRTGGRQDCWSSQFKVWRTYERDDGERALRRFLLDPWSLKHVHNMHVYSILGRRELPWDTEGNLAEQAAEVLRTEFALVGNPCNMTRMYLEFCDRFKLQPNDAAFTAAGIHLLRQAPSKYKVSKEMLDLIAGLNHHDLQLYNLLQQHQAECPNRFESEIEPFSMTQVKESIKSSASQVGVKWSWLGERYAPAVFGAEYMHVGPLGGTHMGC